MLSLLVSIGNFLLLMNLILFIKGFPNQGKAFKIYTFYLAGVFIIQVISGLFKHVLKFENLFLSHFYFIGQFVLLSFFYLTILKKDFQKKIVKVSLVIGLSVLGIQFANDTSLFFKFNLFEIVITSFLLIVFASFHFYNLLNERKEFYYINMGILMYLFGSTILFLTGNLSIMLHSKFNKIPWTLNAFLYIVYQIFVLIEWKKSFSNKTRQ
jgi:hypothetical protein